MAKHVHEYGWIMQYPQGKIDITGYTFETWHYRYVGENWLMISMQVGSQWKNKCFDDEIVSEAD